ncbi:cob(I)yrinic acid a,c-diamide adenosyltransferase [Sphingomonas adhaesiva]|uniref:cob(I)yrinic acid a,c-diamide adenosyltransferase n=1 Tax=Sphingomonas adhaesiva TaxID=28212 RepID=UPI002FF718A8
MVRLNRIYTRTGDAGTTGLVDGSRVSKSDARMQAIGDVDEANSTIGVALATLTHEAVRAELALVQNDLFDLGADLATPGRGADEDFAPSEMVLRIVPAQVERLERAIDTLNEHLEPLRSFILPGGAAAHLHVARATVRRAERSAVAITHGANPQALKYLNRLSDFLFVACRVVNQSAGGDVLWVAGANR